MRRFFSLCVVCLVMACDPTPQACPPGRVLSCACPSGGMGAQTCRDDGRSWGSCDCGSGGVEKISTETSREEGSSTPDGGVRPEETAPETSTPETTPEKTESKICFSRDILPIFQANCALSGCHDAISREDHVDLSSYAGVMASKEGEGIRPGRPDKSEIYESITEKDLEDRMPPPPQAALAPESIEKIRKWIEEGAKDEPCESNPTCNTTGLGYAKEIAPLFTRSCVGCHNPSLPSGGVRLDTLELIKQTDASGKLMPSIRHDAGAKPMPPQGPKLSDCEISQITQWIKDGYTP